MDKAKKYCTVDPPFPEQGFGAIIVSTRPNRLPLPLPFDYIAPTLSELSKLIGFYRKILITESPQDDFAEFCILLPLILDRRIPLRKEHWEHPDISYSPTDYIKPFFNAVDEPEMHSLIVTPSLDKDIWRFRSALPVPASTPDSVIDHFLMYSNWPVSIAAKNVGVYRFLVPKNYDWVRMKVLGGKLPRFDKRREN